MGLMSPWLISIPATPRTMEVNEDWDMETGVSDAVLNGVT